MIILDTNLVSETMRMRPDAKVLSWLDQQPKTDIFLTVITVAELFYGTALLPDGRRRHDLRTRIDEAVEIHFRRRILSFDLACAEHYSGIMAGRRRAGAPVSTLDAQIAAITRQHKATLVTRNVRDFEGCGIDLINPWDEE